MTLMTLRDLLKTVTTDDAVIAAFEYLLGDEFAEQDVRVNHTAPGVVVGMTGIDGRVEMTGMLRHDVALYEEELRFLDRQ